MPVSLYFSLMLTLTIETWIYRWLKPSSIRFLLAIMGMNAVLNPLMNMLLLRTSFYQYGSMLIVFELLVIIIEMVIIHVASGKKWFISLLFAMIANMVSLLLGLFFNLFEFTNAQVWIFSVLVSLPLVGLWSWIFFQYLFQHHHE